MRSCGQTWLAVLILLAALLARMLWPAGTAALRREAMRVLAAERGSFELVQAMGRAAESGDWRGELITALGNGMREPGA